MATSPNGAPQVTWSVVIAALGVLSVIAGGAYAIIGAQFLDQSRQIDLNRRDLESIRKEFLTLREHTAFQHEQETVNTALRTRLTVVESRQSELASHSAHSPVEAKEVDILSASIDKRFDAEQQQINDINRQIAASIIQSQTSNPSPTAPR